MKAASHSLSDTGLLCVLVPNGGQDDSVDLRSGLRTVSEVYIHQSGLQTVYSGLLNGLQDSSLPVAMAWGPRW